MRLVVHRVRAAMNETGSTINVGRNESILVVQTLWTAMSFELVVQAPWAATNKMAEQKLTAMHLTGGTNAKCNDKDGRKKLKAAANATGSSHAKGGSGCNWQCKHQGQCKKWRHSTEGGKKSHWQQHVAALTQCSNATWSYYNYKEENFLCFMGKARACQHDADKSC